MARRQKRSVPNGSAIYPQSASHRDLHHAASESALSLHWLFRSNLPRRKGTPPVPIDIRKRNFFGLGEVIRVVTNVSRVR